MSSLLAQSRAGLGNYFGVKAPQRVPSYFGNVTKNFSTITLIGLFLVILLGILILTRAATFNNVPQCESVKTALLIARFWGALLIIIPILLFILNMMLAKNSLLTVLDDYIKGEWVLLIVGIVTLIIMYYANVTIINCPGSDKLSSWDWMIPIFVIFLSMAFVVARSSKNKKMSIGWWDSIKSSASRYWPF